MGNREKWTIGMAILGGIAASFGEVRSPVDTILGATINGAVTFGIATIYISLKKSKRNKTSTASDTTERNTMTPPNFDNSQIPSDMEEFLQTLEVVPGRYDGWYKDPSNLYRLRYFHKGKWTLAVSETDSETEKKSALSKYIHPNSSSPTPRTQRLATEASTNPLATVSSTPNNVGLGQKIEQLERIAELRNRDMISEAEYEQLKRDVLS